MLDVNEPRFHGGQTARQVVVHLPWSEEIFDRKIAEVREELDHAIDVCDLPEMLSLCRELHDLEVLKAAKAGG